MNFVLFLREREREREKERERNRGENASKGGAESERETHNPKQAPGSELSAQSPTGGSNSQAVRP